MFCSDCFAIVLSSKFCKNVKLTLFPGYRVLLRVFKTTRSVPRGNAALNSFVHRTQQLDLHS